MQSRRKGRKRIIKLMKDQEQLAQDKLLEISCLSEDKFVDQSHMLSIEQKVQQQEDSDLRINRDIKNIIEKYKHISAKVKTQNKVYAQKSKPKSDNRKFAVLIANKLESSQVFVGIKPKPNIDTKTSQLSFLILDKQKVRTLSTPTNHQMKSIGSRKFSTELSDKVNFCILGERKREQSECLHFSGDKIATKRHAKLQSLRGRLRTEFFFSRPEKYRTIDQKILKIY